MTTGQSMPITPKHTEIINQVLQATAVRVQEIAPTIGYRSPPALQPEQIQQSPLAKNLRIIARYAEGYDLGEGSILPSIQLVGRVLFGFPLKRGYRFPRDFHRTPLGELINEALVRRFPLDQRVNVSEARQLLQVTRQTLHQWAEAGTLQPIYEQGQLTFLRLAVEQLHQKRQSAKKISE